MSGESNHIGQGIRRSRLCLFPCSTYYSFSTFTVLDAEDFTPKALPMSIPGFDPTTQD